MRIMENENSTLKTIAGLLIGLYLISTQVMTVYFWWQYMKEDNFIVAILIDPVISEFKGLLWPFFI